MLQGKRVCFVLETTDICVHINLIGKIYNQMKENRGGSVVPPDPGMIWRQVIHLMEGTQENPDRLDASPGN